MNKLVSVFHLTIMCQKSLFTSWLSKGTTENEEPRQLKKRFIKGSFENNPEEGQARHLNKRVWFKLDKEDSSSEVMASSDKFVSHWKKRDEKY